jgi:hypothetical protein
VKHKGNPPQTLIAQASDPQVGVEEFKAAVANETHQPTDKAGKWWDYLGGFYCSPEEKAEFERAIQCAVDAEPMSPEIPDWMRRKEVLWRWAAEFLSAYGGETNVDRIPSVAVSG